MLVAIGRSGDSRCVCETSGCTFSGAEGMEGGGAAAATVVDAVVDVECVEAEAEAEAEADAEADAT